MAKESKAKQSDLFRKWLAGEYRKGLHPLHDWLRLGPGPVMSSETKPKNIAAIEIARPNLEFFVDSSGGEPRRTNEDEHGALVKILEAKLVDFAVNAGLDPEETLADSIGAGWLKSTQSTFVAPDGRLVGPFRWISAKVLGGKPKAKSVGRNRDTEPEAWERLNKLWGAFFKECDENTAKKLVGQRKRSIEHFVYWARLQGHEYTAAAVRKIKKAEREYRLKERRN